MSNQEQLQDESGTYGRPTLNREVKSSVFTDLFGSPKYAFQFFQALHPEDTTSTVADVQIVTLDNVLTDKQYNDLGFRVGDKLIVLVERQSTWSENIVVRIFLYVAQTFNEYINERKLNLYGGKKVKLPKPEAYVVYTGERDACPDLLSLNELFWDGDEDYAVDVRVKVVRDGRDGDIINQYVLFTKILTEQIAIHKKTRKALEETIRICKDRNILREYLESREKEIVDIMITLFDHAEIQERYVAQERREAWEEGREEGREEARAEYSKREAELKEKAERASREKLLEFAKNLLADLGLSPDAVAKCSGLPLADVEELAKSVGK